MTREEEIEKEAKKFKDFHTKHAFYKGIQYEKNHPCLETIRRVLEIKAKLDKEPTLRMDYDETDEEVILNWWDADFNYKESEVNNEKN